MITTFISTTFFCHFELFIGWHPFLRPPDSPRGTCGTSSTRQA